MIVNVSLNEHGDISDNSFKKDINTKSSNINSTTNSNNISNNNNTLSNSGSTQNLNNGNLNGNISRSDSKILLNVFLAKSNIYGTGKK